MGKKSSWPWLDGAGYPSVVEWWNAPFKVRNHAGRLLLLPGIRAGFALAGVRWGRGWRVFGMPMLQKYRGSTIRLGDRLELRSSRRSNPLTPYQPVVLATRSAQAVISVGDDCGLTGAVLVSETAITLGHRVLIGANVVICDTDFHPTDPELRRRFPQAGVTRAVTIEDDVFVGTQAIILKGVTIGRGAVVGAGAVVSRNVPAYSIVAGNPARVVGKASKES